MDEHDDGTFVGFLIAALFAWRELSLGKLRILIQLEIFAGVTIAF